MWHAAALVMLVLTSGAGCASGSAITADSTCGDYLSTQTEARHAAAASVSRDLHAYNGGNSMWGTGLDYECATAPDMTLRAYFAGQKVMSVPSVSMEHTINAGDTIVVNTLAYQRDTRGRGDVVVFTAPPAWRADPAEAQFVKRIVATGGDHLVCCDRQARLTLNGQPLDEPYLYRDAEGRTDAPSETPFDIVVPAGRVWIMGDHRSRSGDSLAMFMRSRDIAQATIPVDALVGRAFAVVDPGNQDELRWLTVPSTYADIPSNKGS
jgi:signal peptidase I